MDVIDLEIGNKIYISNLDEYATNEDLQELFSEIGELKSWRVHRDKLGNSRGTAEVVFARRSDAERAKKLYNNRGFAKAHSRDVDFDYINVLQDDTFDFGKSGENAYEALGPLLVNAESVADDAEARWFCMKLAEKFYRGREQIIGLAALADYEEHVAAADAAAAGMASLYNTDGDATLPKDIRMENFSISMGGRAYQQCICHACLWSNICISPHVLPARLISKHTALRKLLACDTTMSVLGHFKRYVSSHNTEVQMILQLPEKVLVSRTCMSDESSGLQGQKLVTYKGDYDTFERTYAEHLANQQKPHKSNERTRAHIQAFVDKFRYNTKRASLALDRTSVVNDRDYKFEFPGSIISFSDTSFGYPGGPVLSRNLNIGLDLDSRLAGNVIPALKF
ncbi:hypothetical protein SELMODRAFT_402061 [Selaginella moellendorffii]|uniref:RRM domain-containing protein n=1 Tax=Selaginella moellendorffii TaxID=88036 RepID=D8QPG5_SELML|nr:hypothetical protein SELMODRAFT_402061 [Selaginella moellendorffii]